MNEASQQVHPHSRSCTAEHPPTDAPGTPRASSDEFTFYYGAASGSCRKALRQLEEPNVMINYATANNVPWDGIENLYIDSGGYSFMRGKGEYTTTDEEYLDYVDEHSPHLYAYRDYPCESEVLEAHDRSVRQHQSMTTDRHRALAELHDERGIESHPMCVLQGWSVEDYLRHLDELRDHGVLTAHVGVGSVCRRHREQEIAKILTTIAKELGPGHNLHAFGVKISVLKEPGVVDILHSADSQAFELDARYNYDPCTFREVGLEYLKYKHRLEEILGCDREGAQTSLDDNWGVGRRGSGSESESGSPGVER